MRPTEYNNYTEQTLCRACIEHRGDRVRRAEEHEADVRKRWADARGAANKMEERLKAAFGSRDRAVRKLNRLRDLHEYTGTRGACECGVKNCKTLELLEDPWLVDRIADLRRRDREQEAWFGDGEDWEPYGINPPRPNG